MMRISVWLLAAVPVALSGCAGTLVPRATAPEPVARPVAAPPSLPVKEVAPGAGGETALARGIVAGPGLADIAIDRVQAEKAVEAFRISCPLVQARSDASGLTRAEDWAEPCTAAASSAALDDPAQFFARHFALVQVGDGTSLATGYFEPEIAGSRIPRRGYGVAVYRRPPDLIEADLGRFAATLNGRRIRGRVEGTSLVPYADRAAIEDGALAGRGLELAWAADPVEFFFLQVQGSGRLRLPDGSVMRIGYDGQNGHDYTGIGRLMLDRGLLQPGQSSMQGIMAWLRANPVEGRTIMRENRSFVFFRELTGPGPIGALGLPVTPRATVAVDPAFIPMGAPVLLSLDRAEPNGIWIAQDTGGAIKGANRVDTFWGAGDEARAIAGGMAARGSAFILLPRASAARLLDGRPDARR